MQDQETYNIIGAAMEVHKALGPGLLESAYGDALEIEFKLRDIPYQRETELPINYKGHILKTKYFADFVCYGHVILELKTVEKLLNIHQAQILHYLNITGIKKGLLINFKNERLDYHRYVTSIPQPPIRSVIRCQDIVRHSDFLTKGRCC